MLLILIVQQRAAHYLYQVDQCPGEQVLEAIQPSFNALVREDLLNHEDEDVKVLLAVCLCEILRITVHDTPYSDDILRVTMF